MNFARYYDVCLYSRSSVNDSSLKFNWFRGWEGKVKSGGGGGKKKKKLDDARTYFFPSRLRFTGINLLGVKTREEQLSTLRRRAIFFSSYIAP